LRRSKLNILRPVIGGANQANAESILEVVIQCKESSTITKEEVSQKNQKSSHGP